MTQTESTFCCKRKENMTKLYKQTGQIAMHKISNLVGNQNDALEIVQDVFTKLWEKKLTFESEKSAYCWIYRACHNAAIDHMRRRGLRPTVAMAGQELLLPSRDDRAQQFINRDTVCKALAMLEEVEAQIYIYSVVDGMTQDEIAELIGKTRKTVYRTLTKIKEKLAPLAMAEGA